MEKRSGAQNDCSTIFLVCFFGSRYSEVVVGSSNTLSKMGQGAEVSDIRIIIKGLSQ